MRAVKEALGDVREIYQKVMGRPAPDISSTSCFAFPPGVDPIEYALMEVNQLRQYSEKAEQVAPVPRWIPHADCFLKSHEFIARVEVPGIPREDLQVFMVGNECVVRGDRKPPENGLSPLALERPWGPFERRFAVPSGTRDEGIEARCLNGILELRIPIARASVDECKVEVQ